MASEVSSSIEAERVLASLAVPIGSYLDPPTLLALCRTSKACREAYWTNDVLWKDVVQSQLWLFPGQEKGPHEDTASQENSMPWRETALTMHNALVGRYRMVLLDSAGEYTNDEDDSDFDGEDDDADDSAEESLARDDDVDDCKEEAPANDDEDTDGSNDSPNRILVDDRLVSKNNLPWTHICRLWRQRRGAHYVWAEALYNHYRDNILHGSDAQQQLQATDYPPWSYDYPFVNHAPTELGTQRSCLLNGDTNGTVVFSSWHEDLVVVDTSSGKDSVVRRLEGYELQDWCMGDDMIVCLDLFNSLICNYNLLDPKEEHQAKTWFDPGYDHQVIGAHGDYILVESRLIYYSLVHLNRTTGRLDFVYEPETLKEQIRRMIFSLRQLDPDESVLGKRVVITPEAMAESFPPVHPNEDAVVYENYQFRVTDFVVHGRMLLMAISSIGGGAAIFPAVTLVVDMKTDSLLYAIHMGGNVICKKFQGNRMTNGSLMVMEESHILIGGSRFDDVGLLFGPKLSHIDQAHSSWIRLLESCKAVTVNPFHRHPNTRLPLNSLLKLPPDQRLCDASDQCLLVDLEIWSMMSETAYTSPDIVFLDPLGAKCGCDSSWSFRHKDYNPQALRKEAWQEPSNAVNLLYPTRVCDASVFAAYLESPSVSGGKFWSVFQKGADLTLAFGKIRTRGNISTTAMGDAGKARAHAICKYYEKRLKGYYHVPGKQPIEPTSRTTRKRRGQQIVRVPAAAATQPETAEEEDDTKPPPAKKKAKTAVKQGKKKKCFQAYLTMDSSTGGKFWSVYQCENEVTIAFGRINTRGNITTTTMDSAGEALKDARKKLAAKKKKGYTLVKGKDGVRPEIEVPEE